MKFHIETFLTWFLKETNFQLDFPSEGREKRINTKRTNSRLRNSLVESNMSKVGALSVMKYISVRKIERGHTREKVTGRCEKVECRIVRRKRFFFQSGELIESFME